MFVKTVEIKDEMTDPDSGEIVEKNVFICFFQGNQLEQRVKKICDGSVTYQKSQANSPVLYGKLPIKSVRIKSVPHLKNQLLSKISTGCHAECIRVVRKRQDDMKFEIKCQLDLLKWRM